MTNSVIDVIEILGDAKKPCGAKVKGREETMMTKVVSCGNERAAVCLSGWSSSDIA